MKRLSVTLDADVEAIIEAHRGRESTNRTINRLIRSAATLESDKVVLYRTKELNERTLAAVGLLVGSLIDGDTTEQLKDALKRIRNEKIA